MLIQEYVKTARGKHVDDQQVFALIDEIRKNQVEKGLTVFDDDFQQLAAAARDRVANAGKGSGIQRKRQSAASDQLDRSEQRRKIDRLNREETDRAGEKQPVN